MPWFRVSPHLYSHPKWRQASAGARALWISAGSYTAAFGLDFMPDHCLRIVNGQRRHARELVDLGLWEEVDGGWRIAPQPHSRGRVLYTISAGDLREKIPQGLRRAVIERDGLQCRLCGHEVDPDDVHIDHIQPVTKGGRNRLDNLQVAHSRCNIRKGNRT